MRVVWEYLRPLYLTLLSQRIACYYCLSGRKYAHTNSYNSAMTVIAQDDHLTAGAWVA